MGKQLREGTQECWDFTPDDTDTRIYVLSGMDNTMADLLDIAKRKWPSATLDDLVITSEKIHTRAIYYDRYDGSDYDDYILIDLKS